MDNWQESPVWKWRTGQVPECTPDPLAPEEPLEIRLNGRSISVTMRTPGQDEELALGFLHGEGILESADDVRSVSVSPRNADGNVVDVRLADDVPVDFDRLTRHVFASSSCGLCGKAAIDQIHCEFPPVQPGFQVNPEVLLRLTGQLVRAQSGFARTGGLHAAGLFDGNGGMLAVREDVGRHNAVDKLVGWGMQTNRLPFNNFILMVSGRASFEIIQKALAVAVPVVCAVSAPSSLAVQCAQASGMTLVGFLREARMNIYSHPDRMINRESKSLE